MDLRARLVQNPTNPKCYAVIFEPEYVMFVWAEDSSNAIENCNNFTLRMWEFDRDWASYRKDSANYILKYSSANDNLKITNVLSELRIDIPEGTTGDIWLDNVKREDLIDIIAKMDRLFPTTYKQTFGEDPKGSVPLPRKKGICPECGGTGIVDMEFYKRKCLNPEFHSG